VKRETLIVKWKDLKLNREPGILHCHKEFGILPLALGFCFNPYPLTFILFLPRTNCLRVSYEKKPEAFSGFFGV